MNIEKNSNSSVDIDVTSRKLLNTFREMYWWMVPDNFVIFDLETTGITPRRDRILEIGAISINKKTFLENGVIDTFECFIKQEKPIPKEAQRINKITDEMVANGLSEIEALTNFFEFCKGKFMLAYNSTFDVKFLNWAAKRNQFPIEEEYLESVQDIYKLAKKYLKNDRITDKRLITIAEAIGIRAEQSHRALVDAVTAFYVYMFLKQLEFNDIHYDSLQSIKRVAAIVGGSEKEYVDSLMKSLYLTEH